MSRDESAEPCPECGGRGFDDRGEWCSRLDTEGHCSSAEALENRERDTRRCA